MISYMQWLPDLSHLLPYFFCLSVFLLNTRPACDGERQDAVYLEPWVILVYTFSLSAVLSFISLPGNHGLISLDLAFMLFPF